MKDEILLNKNADKGKFHFSIPMSVDNNGKVNVIEKSIKDNNGNEIKIKRLLGEASNNNVDKGDERVSKSWLSKMLNSLIGLNVFVEHEHHLEKTVGVISETAGNDESVKIFTDLEDESENKLVKSILSKAKSGIGLYYSIWGRVTKAVKKYDDELKKTVTELIDGEIYEVSVTTLPEGNVSPSIVIAKSLNDAFPNEENNEESIEIDEMQDMNAISKALNEMVQQTKISDMMRELYWAFTDAIYKITKNENLNPEEKKNKINNLSSEYGTEIESLSGQFAILTQTIEQELS